MRAGNNMRRSIWRDSQGNNYSIVHDKGIMLSDNERKSEKQNMKQKTNGWTLIKQTYRRLEVKVAEGQPPRAALVVKSRAGKKR